jgi:hypothetical protein
MTPLWLMVLYNNLCAGEVTISEDFDVPLPENILSAIESK